MITRVWRVLVRPALTVLCAMTATTWTTETATWSVPVLVRHNDFCYDICCCLMSLKTEGWGEVRFLHLAVILNEIVTVPCTTRMPVPSRDACLPAGEVSSPGGPYMAPRSSTCYSCGLYTTGMHSHWNTCLSKQKSERLGGHPPEIVKFLYTNTSWIMPQISGQCMPSAT